MLFFDPKSESTHRSIKTQARAWGAVDGSEDTYVVVEDCGPCIVAAFTFRHHAKAFLGVCGQESYMADASGGEVSE